MRASMRASVVVHKKEEKKKKRKEGVFSSALKVIEKRVPKRKANGKDDHPSKKASVILGEKQPKKLSPPKSSHVIGKGLMTMSGP